MFCTVMFNLIQIKLTYYVIFAGEDSQVATDGDARQQLELVPHSKSTHAYYYGVVAYQCIHAAASPRTASKVLNVYGSC